MKSRERIIEDIAKGMYRDAQNLISGDGNWNREPSYLREYFIRKATKIFDKEDDSYF